MAIPKQNIPISFVHGVDTKTDPKQVQLGKFLSLENSVFTETALLKKRNGFGPLSTLPNSASTYLTTFGGNLTAIGNHLEAYAAGTETWIDKGIFHPISLSVLPVVRSSLNQTQADSVLASNGFLCTVFTEVNNGVAVYKYVIQDSTTGQNIVTPTVIPVGSGIVTGSPRVFLLGGYFIVAFTNVISGTSHLQYIAVSVGNPTTVTANADIASSYISATTLSWDGVVAGQNLYVAYNTTAGGQQIAVVTLNTALVVSAATSFAASICTMISLYADTTVSGRQAVYITFYDAAGSTGYVAAVNQNLTKLMTPTEIISSGTVNNITCTAQNGVCSIAYEVANVYSYDNNISSNYLDKVDVALPATVTTGTVGSTTTFVRSVGLASKAFLVNGVEFMLCAYDGKQATTTNGVAGFNQGFQPTYFLVNNGGKVLSRFAFENGGGYLTTGLPQAQVIGSTVRIAYLYKDLIQSVNTQGGLNTAGLAGSPAGIYSQTGVNLASLAYSSSTLSTVELGQNLNISSGLMFSYDGNTLNEQNFNLFPESLEITLVADPAPTATVTSTSKTITALSALTGIVVGMNVTGTGVPANTVVTAVGASTVTMSNAATGSHSSETITFTGNVSAQAYYVQAIYQWTDAQGNIVNSAPSVPVAFTATTGHSSYTVNGPMLRLTYKSGVKIILYRWATDQQNYYQITSISNPLLNSTTSDSWTLTDIQSSAEILGNSLIYTDGGVVENIGGTACTALTIFDTRVFSINAEDQNLLNFSKQVIENVPVEMSDVFSLYVAPNAGTSTNTGPMRCLAPMDDKLIIFKANAIYYINGTGPDNTGINNQYSQPIFITSTVGSVNQNSISLIPAGLMFQSDKGIWLLGRDLSTRYIGADVEGFNSATVNSANAIPGTTQVRFTLSTGVILMYDYYYNEWGTFVGAPAISSTVFNNLHTVLNSQGVVSQETPGVYLDNGNPVLMQFTTGWFNLAGLQGYIRAFYFYLLGQYFTPHKIAVGIAYDYSQSPEQLTVISPTNYSPAYGQPGPYGQGTPFGGANSNEQWRVFLTKQRCQAFQISMQESYDPSLGVPAGAGFTLSGLNLVVAMKKGWRPISSAESVGGQQ